MDLLTAFKNSLLLPKKDVIFRLNRVNMGYVIGYIFILMFIPLLLNSPELISEREFTNDVPLALYLVYLLFLYYLPLVVLCIMGISLLAAICMILRTLLHRKLSYRQLWKICTFVLTVPILLYLIVDLLHLNDWILNLVLPIYFIITIVRMITIYPKVRH